MRATVGTKAFYVSLIVACCLAVLGAILMAIDSTALSFLRCGAVCLTAAALILLIDGIYTFLSCRFYKGYTYGITYMHVKQQVKQALIDAGYSDESPILHELVIPRISISFSDDLTKGILRIRSSLHHNHRLLDAEISSALGQYVVENIETSDDANWIEFHFYDYRAAQSIKICSAGAYQRFASQCAYTELQLDQRSAVRLQHSLIVGATGSGKTYCLFGLIYQMLLKKPHYDIWFADPKRSSLYALGRHLKAQHNEYQIVAIASELHAFHEAMMRRAEDMQGGLSDGIDFDYRTLGFSPSIFIIDEYIAFISSVQMQKKEIRDAVNADLRDIVLMGRQLGFFIFIVMQKSDATTLPTMLRDSLTLKVVLGSAEDTTYTTAFGPGARIPAHSYKVGEGVYTSAGQVNKPRIVCVPTIAFDIFDAMLSEISVTDEDRDSDGSSGGGVGGDVITPTRNKHCDCYFCR